MVTVAEVVNWASSLANRGAGVDADGAYGMQCVDLPNMISIKFFGKRLAGNAIDLLNSAAANGYRVERSGAPKAGAIFVQQIYSHAYGHTGLVIQDYNGSGYLRTIEQNVDGGIYTGGPARFRNTPMNGGGGRIIGWFYPPYSDTGSLATPSPAPSNPTPKETEHEDMHFTFNIKNDPGWNPETVFYYNGSINEVQGVHNTEELKYIDAIYKETTGRTLSHYNWDAKQAPVYLRVFGVLCPGSQTAAIVDALKKIQEQIDGAV